MSNEYIGLPALIKLEEFGGNYASYIDAVYDIFHHDFIANKAKFGSHILRMKYHPLQNDRAYTFYHMTHTGEKEDERLPDLRRCERIGWARPSVQNVESWHLRFWRQTRQKSKNRICILLEVDDDSDYFVILEVRETYVLLWTAFVSLYANETKRKLKEYGLWKQNEGAHISTPDQLVEMIQSQIKKARS